MHSFEVLMHKVIIHQHFLLTIKLTLSFKKGSCYCTWWEVKYNKIKKNTLDSFIISCPYFNLSFQIDCASYLLSSTLDSGPGPEPEQFPVSVLLPASHLLTP